MGVGYWPIMQPANRVPECMQSGTQCKTKEQPDSGFHTGLSLSFWFSLPLPNANTLPEISTANTVPFLAHSSPVALRFHGANGN
jgi:hypothetical protein